MPGDRLPYRFPGRFTFVETADSPTVEADEPGVALALGRAVCGPDSLGVVIHATLGLDAEFFYAFKQAIHAIVLTIEELGTGRAVGFRLIDPAVDYLRPMSPNFDESELGEPSGVFLRGWVNAPVELRVEPEPKHPGLWFQAHLRDFHSQRIHLAIPAA